MNCLFNTTKKHGHTLIEILVVISIIGILAGLVATGMTSAIRRAKIAKAKNIAMNLRNAITAYYTDYRRFPLVSEKSNQNDFVDYATDEKFMEILLSADTPTATAANPRRTVYFSGVPSAKRFTNNTFINGMALNDNGSGSGSLWDPWGRMYGVRIDTKNRERMPNPETTEPNLNGNGAPEWGSGKTDAQKYISQSVVIWSSGNDPERASDNVKTW